MGKVNVEVLIPTGRCPNWLNALIRELRLLLNLKLLQFLKSYYFDCFAKEKDERKFQLEKYLQKSFLFNLLNDLFFFFK